MSVLHSLIAPLGSIGIMLVSALKVVWFWLQGTNITKWFHACIYGTDSKDNL